MRNTVIISLILFLFISCGKKEDKINIETGINNQKDYESLTFREINYSLKYNYLDSLGKHINPNKKYEYWQYATYNTSFSENKTYKILKQDGDLLLRKKINEKIRPDYSVGIFKGGHPNFRCNYVSTIENGKVNYLRTEEEFRDFLGTIDNLEEAMLLAETYGFILGRDIEGSEYCEVENGFVLHLVKYHEFPVLRELVEVVITKDGFIKTRTRGIHCEGRDCI